MCAGYDRRGEEGFLFYYRVRALCANGRATWRVSASHYDRSYVAQGIRVRVSGDVYRRDANVLRGTGHSELLYVVDYNLYRAVLGLASFFSTRAARLAGVEYRSRVFPSGALPIIVS